MNKKALIGKWNVIPAVLFVVIIGSVLVTGIPGWNIIGAGASTAPSQIHLTWATNDVYHTMAVSWWTFGEGTPTVVYDTVSRGGVIGKYAYRSVGVNHRVADFEGWYHDVELTGLEPGTTYYFICGSAGGWSNECKFKTIGLTEQVSLVFGGDSRSTSEASIKTGPTRISNWPYARNWVSTTMAAEDPDFVIFGGDMVDMGNDQVEWADWFDMVQERFITPDGRMIPLVPVIGNHEVWKVSPPTPEGSTYEFFTGLFALPKNVLAPEYSELAYSLDFPNMHVTVLCTTSVFYDLAKEEASEQVNWLESDLAGSNAQCGKGVSS